MVKNQINILTPSPSFGHNLCCKYSNGSCEPILNIKVSRVFQWYKKLFNLMNFDPLNRSLNVATLVLGLQPKQGLMKLRAKNEA